MLQKSVTMMIKAVPPSPMALLAIPYHPVILLVPQVKCSVLLVLVN